MCTDSLIVPPQDFNPRIHITDSDFASITLDGSLCDSRGQLGPDGFAEVIRRQVRGLSSRMNAH